MTTNIFVKTKCSSDSVILYSRFPSVCSRGVALNSGFFILSFCRSVKESIKESASERRQELPAGTGAAPLCQPLKYGADYRDVTAALKMKHLRRFRGERFTFLAVAMTFSQRLRREHGLSLKFILLQSWKPKLSCLHPLNNILFPIFLFAKQIKI